MLGPLHAVKVLGPVLTTVLAQPDDHLLAIRVIVERVQQARPLGQATIPGEGEVLPECLQDSPLHVVNNRSAHPWHFFAVDRPGTYLGIQKQCGDGVPERTGYSVTYHHLTEGYTVG